MGGKGYSADGYARIKGISALITTFGVGELSAANAIAGSYSERVPVVHIVGEPSTASQNNRQLLHHTLGNGDFDVFEKIFAKISTSVVKIRDPANAATMIDHVLRECVIQSRPVYIGLPSDMVTKKVEGARLKTPIDLSLPENPKEKEDYVVSVVLKYLHAAKNPVILVDAGVNRHNAQAEVHELIKKSGIPTFITPMGKGGVDETLPNYGGVYAGTGSNRGVRERVEESDLILNIGPLQSDFNTTGFSYRTSQLNTIEFDRDSVQVRYSYYPDIQLKGVLQNLIATMGELNIEPGPTPSNALPANGVDHETAEITHEWLWPMVGNWLREGDVVLTETGTANFGIWETRFPKNVQAISQVLWGSIGYSVGACLGAALAARELGDNRVLLFVGDGSFQMTAQEISTMIRQGLKPIVYVLPFLPTLKPKPELTMNSFVICNNGYTIERFIHGWDDEYNDIQLWHHDELVWAFGNDHGKYKTHKVKTRAQLQTLFADESFASAPCFQVCSPPLLIPLE